MKNVGNQNLRSSWNNEFNTLIRTSNDFVLESLAVPIRYVCRTFGDRLVQHCIFPDGSAFIADSIDKNDYILVSAVLEYRKRYLYQLKQKKLVADIEKIFNTQETCDKLKQLFANLRMSMGKKIIIFDVLKHVHTKMIGKRNNYPFFRSVLLSLNKVDDAYRMRSKYLQGYITDCFELFSIKKQVGLKEEELYVRTLQAVRVILKDFLISNISSTRITNIGKSFSDELNKLNVKKVG